MNGLSKREYVAQILDGEPSNKQEALLITIVELLIQITRGQESPAEMSQRVEEQVIDHIEEIKLMNVKTRNTRKKKGDA